MYKGEHIVILRFHSIWTVQTSDAPFGHYKLLVLIILVERLEVEQKNPPSTILQPLHLLEMNKLIKP